MKQIRLATALAETAMVKDEGEHPRLGEPSCKRSQPVPTGSREPMGHDHDRECVGALLRRPIEPSGAICRAGRKAKVFAVHASENEPPHRNVRSDRRSRGPGRFFRAMADPVIFAIDEDERLFRL
jgi:hypothetical protein